MKKTSSSSNRNSRRAFAVRTLGAFLASALLVKLLFLLLDPSGARGQIVSLQIFFLFAGVSFFLLFFSGNLRSPGLRNFGHSFAFSFGFLALFFGIFSFAFPHLMHFIPLQTRQLIAEPHDILAQDTKKSLVPKDYIAIFGDSYAYGSGNHWGVRNDWKRSPFHTAALLSKELNRDVLTFGRPGRSNIGGFVTEPTQLLGGLKTHYHLAEPKEILLFFYEGNDLEDNLRELSKRSLALDNFGAMMDFQESLPLKSDISPRTLLFHLVDSLASKTWERLRPRGKKEKHQAIAGTKPVSRKQATSFKKTQTRALINNKLVDFPPGEVNGPALELNSSDTLRSLKLLRNSVAMVRHQHLKSQIALVYIPSPLSLYEFPENIAGTKARTFTQEHIRMRSEKLQTAVRKIADDLRMPFLNTTPSLRAASTKIPLHGPHDWNHFNADGYTHFSKDIARFVRTLPPAPTLNVLP